MEKKFIMNSWKFKARPKRRQKYNLSCKNMKINEKDKKSEKKRGEKTKFKNDEKMYEKIKFFK
jgi:hypothetical protein